MALTVLAFLLFAVMTFSVVMFFTRPSANDRTIQNRLAGVQMAGSRSTPPGDQAAEFLKRTNLSEIPWLNHLLQRWSAAHKIAVLLAQAHSSWSVSTVLLASAVLGTLGFSMVHYWMVELLPAIVLGALAGAFPLLILRIKRDRRLVSFNQKLPDAIDLIARALRAGHSVNAAIEIVAEEAAEPLRFEFAEVHKQQNFGISSRDALLQLGRRVPSTDLQVVLTAILVQKETGGNLVEILDRTAAVLRDRLRIQGELRIHTAQGRLTGWILCALPLVMFGLISLANPAYTAILVHDPAGRKLAYAGASMMALGGLLIRKIVRIKV